VDLESKTNEELMLLLQDGDYRSLEELIRRLSKPLYRFIMRMLPDAAFAEDIVQESFLRVYRYRKNYRLKSKFSTFLYRIAINLATNELKRRSRHAKLIFDGHVDASGDKTDGLEDKYETGETPVLDRMIEEESRELITSALSELPPKLRIPLVLHVYEEMEYPEIARITGVPLGTVKSRINRAKTRLRKWMADHEML
jgi:RNA polymerase sigma-70 factor (ECF subfamily)